MVAVVVLLACPMGKAALMAAAVTMSTEAVLTKTANHVETTAAVVATDHQVATTVTMTTRAVLGAIDDVPTRTATRRLCLRGFARKRVKRSKLEPFPAMRRNINHGWTMLLTP